MAETLYKGIVKKAEWSNDQRYKLIETEDGKKFTAWDDDANKLFTGAKFECVFYEKKKGDKTYLNISKESLVVDMSSKRPTGSIQSEPPADARQARIEHQSLRRDLVTMLSHMAEDDYPMQFTKVQARHKLGEMLLIDCPSMPKTPQQMDDEEVLFE